MGSVWGHYGCVWGRAGCGAMPAPQDPALFSAEDPTRRFQDLREVGRGSFGAVFRVSAMAGRHGTSYVCSRVVIRVAVWSRVTACCHTCAAGVGVLWSRVVMGYHVCCRGLLCVITCCSRVVSWHRVLLLHAGIDLHVASMFLHVIVCFSCVTPCYCL